MMIPEKSYFVCEILAAQAPGRMCEGHVRCSSSISRAWNSSQQQRRFSMQDTMLGDTYVERCKNTQVAALQLHLQHARASGRTRNSISPGVVCWSRKALIRHRCWPFSDRKRGCSRACCRGDVVCTRPRGDAALLGHWAGPQGEGGATEAGQGQQVVVSRRWDIGLLHIRGPARGIWRDSNVTTAMSRRCHVFWI